MSTEQSLNDVLSALELNLAKERKALLGGAYDAIGLILSEKERLGAILDAMLVDPHRAAQLPAYRKRLQKVVDAAKENEKLLAAAKIGAASARARIKDILSQQRMVGVYGEGGDKVVAPGAGVSRQKFA